MFVQLNSCILKNEVNAFLNDFKAKLGVWGIVFRDDRSKNTQALATLELSPMQRIAILKALVPEDYSEGPLAEKLYGGLDMWVFGQEVKQREIYIKISFGVPGTSVICISFHIAEYKMKFPLKKQSL